MTSIIQPRTATSLQWSGQYVELAPGNLLANPSRVVEVDSSGDIILAPTNGADQLCRLDGAGLVPASNLPSYVDDVLSFTNLAAFPVTGEQGKIYVALDTSYSYRWDGSAYFNLSTHQFYTKTQTDTLLDTKLNLSGGTMTGGLNATTVSATGAISAPSLASPDGQTRLTMTNGATTVVTNRDLDFGTSRSIVGLVNATASGTVTAPTLTSGTITSPDGQTRLTMTNGATTVVTNRDLDFGTSRSIVGLVNATGSGTLSIPNTCSTTLNSLDQEARFNMTNGQPTRVVNRDLDFGGTRNITNVANISVGNAVTAAAVQIQQLRSPDGQPRIETQNGGDIVIWNSNVNFNNRSATGIVNCTGTGGVGGPSVSTFGTTIANNIDAKIGLQVGPFNTANGGVARVDGSFVAAGNGTNRHDLVAQDSSWTVANGNVQWNSSYGQFVLSTGGGCLISTGVNAIVLQSTNLRFQTLPTGTGTALVLNSDQVFINSSNVRYKENITAMTIDSAVIHQFQPKEFNFKDQPGQSTIGYLAHEVGAVCPILTTKKTFEGVEEFDSVQYANITVLLVEEVKKQKQQIDALQAQLSSLLIRVQALEASPS